MIPLVATVKEMAGPGSDRAARGGRSIQGKGDRVEYLVGTMIELPRAAWWRTRLPRKPSSSLSAPTTSRRPLMGFSRDDINKFLPAYLERESSSRIRSPSSIRKVWEIGADGYGARAQDAPEAEGRASAANMAATASVEFCHKLGLNYVSCTFSVGLTARLARRRLAASDKLKVEGGRTK